MKKQNGITLIALVISIIVMLILAGVSINAVIGDNGVISKAQETVFLNSCAYLEEYFNQLYATCAIDGVKESEIPLHTIMQNGYQHYFFSTSEGACLKKNYINSENGESQTLVLYLVKKEQLPLEIQSQITGAENLESRDYRKLKGCYGITSDLKVYYCENGLDTIKKLEISDLNADSPDIVYADENSVLAQVMNGGTAPITNQGLKSVKTLTIDNTEKLILLKDFSKFINLTTLYFSNIEIPTLNGIEGAADSINYIKFTNCKVLDYSAMSSLNKLMYLYLVKPAGKNNDIINLCDSEKGIANAKLTKLEYFGIVGNDRFIQSSSNESPSGNYDVTDISPLSNLSSETKEAVKFMYLQNLQLSSISSLEGFKNVYLIRLERNPLVSLDGLQNMSGLKYLYGAYLGSALGTLENEANRTENDALKALQGNKSLYYVYLIGNVNLKRVGYLSECTGIDSLYLSGCVNLCDVGEIAGILAACGTKYSLDGKYATSIIDENTTCIKISDTMKKSTFESLKNCKQLTHLSLYNLKVTDDSGNTLSNEELNTLVNSVLKECTSLNFLQLYGLNYLSTIEFVKTLPNLYDLDLRGSSVTDLTLLNNYASNLKTLKINNTSIDLTTIQGVISKLDGSQRYWTDGNRYGCALYDFNLIKQLEKCTDITYLNLQMQDYIYNYSNIVDLSNCTKLKTIIGTVDICLKIPKECEYLDFIFLCKLYVPEENNLKSVSLHQGWRNRQSMENDWNVAFQNISKSNQLQSFTFTTGINAFSGSSVFSNFASSTLKTFKFIKSDGIWANFKECAFLNNCPNLTTINIDSTGLSDLSGLTNLPKLTTLSLTNNAIVDISPLKNLPSIVTLNLSGNKIIDITELKHLTNVVTLTLNNNMINDVYSLNFLTKMTSCNLQNNGITDISYYTDDTGRKIGYEVMDVFYDLNYEKKGALKNLYISGNAFDDTEILLDLNWGGKSGF